MLTVTTTIQTRTTAVGEVMEASTTIQTMSIVRIQVFGMMAWLRIMIPPLPGRRLASVTLWRRTPATPVKTLLAISLQIEASDLSPVASSSSGNMLEMAIV